MPESPARQSFTLGCGCHMGHSQVRHLSCRDAFVAGLFTFCTGPSWSIQCWAFALVAGTAGCGDTSAEGRSKTLSWTAVPDPSVLGCKAYWGTSSRNYESNIDVGANTTRCDRSSTWNDILLRSERL